MTGPSSVPRPPNATSTRTRTSTRSKLYVDGLMKPELYARRAPVRPIIADPIVAA